MAAPKSGVARPGLETLPSRQLTSSGSVSETKPNELGNSAIRNSVPQAGKPRILRLVQDRMEMLGSPILSFPYFGTGALRWQA